MKKDSARRNCGGLRGVFETALLVFVFAIADLIWPSRELVEGE